jgi:probable H4MPT-linked C1 transfer pathway protein
VSHLIGLDIGGANLKAAHVDGVAVSRLFPVWKHPERLADALTNLLAEFPRVDGLAVTMTAELADCFVTKDEGVNRILDAVEEAAAGRPVRVWQTGGEFVDPDDARLLTRLVAAANWHALATWVGLMVPHGDSLLIDIGTTTTDIIPLRNGLPDSTGRNDVERLMAGELVYTGVRRTPLCAVAPSAPFAGADCPVAAELFATTLDVYLMLGAIAEDESDCETANGRPATKVAAHDRLARTICCDREEVSAEEAGIMAAHFARCQRAQIAASIDRVLAHGNRTCEHVILSGSGAFLAEILLAEHPRLATINRIRLTDLVPKEVVEAACAFAVARLAAERLV